MSKIKELIEKYRNVGRDMDRIMHNIRQLKNQDKEVLRLAQEKYDFAVKVISDLESLSQPTINEGYDLKTLEHIKLIFDIHSDMSSSTNGYRSLCDLIDKIKSNLQLSQPTEDKTKEQILELHFGSEYYKLKELGYLGNISNAMQEFRQSQPKGMTKSKVGREKK